MSKEKTESLLDLLESTQDQLKKVQKDHEIKKTTTQHSGEPTWATKKTKNIR